MPNRKRDKEPVVLLKTKLSQPVIRSTILTRTRLFENLDAGLCGRLVLISAPAGYGKTTLLCDWLRTRKPSAAWVSLEKEDNDPVRFLTYLIAAFQDIIPEAGQSQLEKTASLRTPNFEKWLTLFINDLNDTENDIVLVLDDYHLIDSRKIHDMMEFFLEHQPPHLHTVILTRSDPPLALARLRSQMQLTEIRGNDLSFRAGEISLFFNTILKLELAERDVDLLGSKTEGWAAGLQLAAFSMQSRSDVSGFIRNFEADNRYIADYLMEEVLAHQPEQVQQFLVNTCILDRLNAQLCDAVTGRNDGRDMLTFLENANLFIFPLDKKREWFRYHQLFGDLLKQKLQQSTDSADIANLHRIASHWYEENDFHNEAVKQMLRSGDFDLAADLIIRHAQGLLLHGNVATLKSWIDALPENVIRGHLKLYVYHAMTMVLSSHPISEAESRIKEAIRADRDKSISGEITAFHGLIAAYKGHSRKSIELCEKALRLLPEEDLFFRSFTVGYLGLNYLYSGHILPARKAFREAVNIAGKTGNVMISVLARTHLAELLYFEGKLDEALSMYEKACTIHIGKGSGKQPVMGIALIGIGNLYREWNLLDKAMEHLQMGIRLADRFGEIGVLHGYIGMSRIRQAEGDLKSAAKHLETAGRIAQEFDAMTFDDRIVANYRARFHIATGRLEEAREWTRTYHLGDDATVLAAAEKDLTYMEMFDYSTLVRFNIMDGYPEKAVRLLQHMTEISLRKGWTLFEIDNCLCAALAHDALGDAGSAMESLQRSLRLAKHGRLIRTFLDEGDSVVNLISELRRRGGHTAGMGEYLKAILDMAPADDGYLSPDALSERELEVLRLIADGLTNQEIGDRLYISLNTVRTHTKNINSKLNVHNRTQAIARAREQGII
ncbi:MAG: LuxR C-terminal-related transcriptional regulator [candidate division KSB1 bacterium]|jgi:LuxR family maltose regulon positive regulatory protein|nr:LuxR C-terminal-related transcriptional regulator [candidate division KSB1 bacterium]